MLDKLKHRGRTIVKENYNYYGKFLNRRGRYILHDFITVEEIIQIS